VVEQGCLGRSLAPPWSLMERNEKEVALT